MASTLLTQADGVSSLDALRDAGHEYTDPAASNELAQMENRVAVAQLLQTLSADQYHVIALLFGDEPMTCREAADTLGVSHTEIRRTRDESLARMRKFLEVS